MEAPDVKPDVRKSFCAVCSGLRNCDIKGQASDHWSDGPVWGNTDWFLLQCRGCENIFCHTVKTFSEDYSHEWDEQAQEDVIVMDEDVAYWPAVSGRKRPDWFASMVVGWENSHVLREAMTEMYVALDNDLMRLSAAAIRTAFDIASEILGIDPNLTFAEKLDTLVSTNRINGVDRERLETLCLVSGFAVVFKEVGADRPRDLGLLVFCEVERAAALVFDLGLVTGSSEVHATLSVAPPQPRPSNPPGRARPQSRP